MEQVDHNMRLQAVDIIVNNIFKSFSEIHKYFLCHDTDTYGFPESNAAFRFIQFIPSDEETIIYAPTILIRVKNSNIGIAAGLYPWIPEYSIHIAYENDKWRKLYYRHIIGIKKSTNRSLTRHISCAHAWTRMTHVGDYIDKGGIPLRPVATIYSGQ